MNYHRVFYTGLDIGTFDLLAKDERFKIVAVNFIADFITSRTYNPFNLLFKLLYKLYYLKSNHLLIKPTFLIFKLCKPYFTSIYAKYSTYLEKIIKNGINIIDLNSSNTNNAVNYIKYQNIDVMILNNWWIMSEKIINAPKYGTINIHPSKLPKYRGSNPSLWVLKNHDTETAVTYIVLDVSVDGGDIISQHPIIIENKENSITLEDKQDKVIKLTLIKDLIAYLNGEIKLSKQDKKLASGSGKYYEYMKIKWEEEAAQDIYNKVILYPYLWPLDLCYGYINLHKIHFKNLVVCETNNNINSLKPGQYYMSGIYLMIRVKDKVIKAKLFKDIPIKDSITMLYYGNKSLNTTIQ